MAYSKYVISLIFFSCLFLACNKKTSPPIEKNITTSEPTKGDDEKITNLSLKGTWSVTSFPYESRTLSPNVSYTVEFGDDNVAIQLKVNTCGTSCSYSDEVISIKEILSCTEACCDSKEGQTLSRLFKGELKYSITKNILLITTPQGTIRLVQGSTSKLTGTTWLAESSAGIKDGKQIKFEKEYFLSFDNTRVRIMLDVNSCNTSCEYLNGKDVFRLPTSNMACTRACCDNEDGRLLMQGLQGEISYTKEGKNLVLKTFNKIIIFSPAKAKE
jgi:heat shock protein HslJ